jgi:hypothetical protein
MHTLHAHLYHEIRAFILFLKKFRFGANCLRTDSIQLTRSKIKDYD